MLLFLNFSLLGKLSYQIVYKPSLTNHKYCLICILIAYTGTAQARKSKQACNFMGITLKAEIIPKLKICIILMISLLSSVFSVVLNVVRHITGYSVDENEQCQQKPGSCTSWNSYNKAIPTGTKTLFVDKVSYQEICKVQLISF